MTLMCTDMRVYAVAWACQSEVSGLPCAAPGSGVSVMIRPVVGGVRHKMYTTSDMLLVTS